ncbi:Vms1/Ankzf1 family peptidyl-tRNA hydrolase [Actinospica robiniae]|uniref:baeRF2 domain-containing protein n=1 Tax=Actinospica robiniae TaxID=304901 RepID=UPI0004254714|nr:Vms1/Ankzf1 family peptidyl-tRNA hydrolase [Actinospica robiniae]
MELALLRPLYTAPPNAEVVTVHVDTSRQDQDADKRLELTWRDLRRMLEGQGADEPSLAALDPEVGSSPHIAGPQGESLFAAGGRVLGAFSLSQPPAQSQAMVGPVVDPLETVLDLDHQMAHIVVALDRSGGDITAYPAGAFDPDSHRTYDGTTLHLNRVGAGGPSMASYHRRSVNAWESNAAGVAREVAEAAAEVGAAVVFVAGDPKALPLFHEQLAALNVDADAVEVAGGRGGKSAENAMRASVDQALAEASLASHRKVMAEYSDALGEGRAVHGIPAVSQALTEGAVETLLLSADRAADPMKWATTQDQRMIATSREGLGEAADGAFEAKAGPLMLRAATAGDASFSELLPGTKADDGCAAILRYRV